MSAGFGYPHYLKNKGAIFCLYKLGNEGNVRNKRFKIAAKRLQMQVEPGNFPVLDG